MQGAEFFGKFDLSDAYHQMEHDNDAKEVRTVYTQRVWSR